MTTTKEKVEWIEVGKDCHDFNIANFGIRIVPLDLMGGYQYSISMYQDTDVGFVIKNHGIYLVMICSKQKLPKVKKLALNKLKKIVQGLKQRCDEILETL